MNQVRSKHKSLINHFPHSILSLEEVRNDAIHLVNDIQELDAMAENSKAAIHITFSKDKGVERKAGLLVRLHDVLSTDLSTPHGSMFHYWWKSAREGKIPKFETNGAYWCSPEDVAEGLLRLIGSGNALSGTIDVCGRRHWTMEDTWSEFQMLVSRTAAGHDGSFHLSHLEADGGPAVRVEDLAVASTKKLRPHLEAVHNMLLNASGEGWNPRTPFRQSLMLLVAELTLHYAEGQHH